MIFIFLNNFCTSFTAWQVSVFWVFMVRIFQHLDQKNSKYGSFSRSARSLTLCWKMTTHCAWKKFLKWDQFLSSLLLWSWQYILCCPKIWEHLRENSTKDETTIESLKNTMRSGNQKLVVANQLPRTGFISKILNNQSMESCYVLKFVSFKRFFWWHCL